MRLSLKAFVWITGAVAVAAGGFVSFNSSGNGSATTVVTPPPMSVPVVLAQQRTVPVYLDFVGATEAIRSVTLEAKVTGYLDGRPVGDGADVQKDQLLYQIDPRDYQAALDQVTAQARRDAAAFDYSRVAERRNAVLSKDGWVSRDTFDQATSTFHQSEATLLADSAAVRTAKLNLQYTEIRAPFAGRLGRSFVHEGALISAAGTQLNTLVQLDPVYVTFNPSETDLSQLGSYQIGKTIPAEVTMPDAGAKRYEGTLTFLNNTVDRSTGTIVARATIANPDHSLLPGQFVHVRLHVADQPSTVLVPQVALGSNQLGKFVYVADNGKAVHRSVSIGAAYGALVVITRGVTAGEAVIVGDPQKITPDASVRPVPRQHLPSMRPQKALMRGSGGPQRTKGEH